ncbi:hypothetical protein Patl1_14022 [Pistacia atlantica]|uniref:Uncharacterized protein n=1 Tax=Pistacia atlantica TaxID=434234 RepID=A0ACC1AU81_9ROSI|nr:hypothetical protein Patl1_14022 [Pistacia atlantica]
MSNACKYYVPPWKAVCLLNFIPWYFSELKLMKISCHFLKLMHYAKTRYKYSPFVLYFTILLCLYSWLVEIICTIFCSRECITDARYLTMRVLVSKFVFTSPTLIKFVSTTKIHKLLFKKG